MLYLIGLGLHKKGISFGGLSALKKCKKVYLEGYTVDFPYDIEKLEKVLRRKVEILDRAVVEGEEIVKEAKKENIALLVYGSPLFATTHMSLLQECKENKVRYVVIYSASVFDAIAETGLQLYKFGKIASMPTWKGDYEPYSFMEIVQANFSIDAHSLILVDIGLKFNDALRQLEKAIEKPGIKVKLDKILVCSNMGNDSKIFYGDVKSLSLKKVKAPFCFVIPAKMHFLEEEVVEGFS